MTRTPYAHAQSVTLVQNTPQAITLTGSGGTLTYSVVTPPAHGTLTGTAPNLTYTPAANYNGTDSFTFLVNNGTSNSTPATVSIGIWAGQPVDFTWLNAASGNWSVAGNWTPGTAPAATGQPYYSLNFTPSGTYTATHDLNNGFLLNQLNMAGAVTIAGTNSLAFAANGTLLPQFNQNSTSAVTISVPVSLTAMTSFGGTNGGSGAHRRFDFGRGRPDQRQCGHAEDLRLNPPTPTAAEPSSTTERFIWERSSMASVRLLSNPMGTGPVTLNSGTIEFDRVTAIKRPDDATAARSTATTDGVPRGADRSP